MTTVLDPRARESKMCLVPRLCCFANGRIHELTGEIRVPKNKKTISDGRRFRDQLDAREKANVEVAACLSSRLVTKDPFNPYKYWVEQRVEFPVRRSLAQCYLTAPATSAESERMFFAGTDIYSHLRQIMTGPTFQKLIFLSRNIKAFN